MCVIKHDTKQANLCLETCYQAICVLKHVVMQTLCAETWYQASSVSPNMLTSKRCVLILVLGLGARPILCSGIPWCEFTLVGAVVVIAVAGDVAAATAITAVENQTLRVETVA